MEPVYINNLKQTRETLIEMNKTYSFASRITFQIAALIIYGFLAFVLAYFYYNYIGAALIAVLGVFLFFYPLIKLHSAAKKREKQILELYGSMLEGQTLFYDDCIVSTNSADKSEVKIDYGKIIKVKQSKNLYLLVMKQKLVIMVNKNDFEKGNCEDFEKFIRTKAVNAKIKI
ncbi:MAG: YcxB family protein [Clostridia bacterium]|nr:YcxB family protein [Clostridia bacterium]